MDLPHIIQPLADRFVTVYESPLPESIYAYSPGIVRLDSGRIVATLDLGGAGVSNLPGKKRETKDGFGQGHVYTSDDGGKSWKWRTDFPFVHARPFVAGGTLYVLGQARDLMIMRSRDGGETWSPSFGLTAGEYWHQAPSNVHFANGCVYLVMEKRTRMKVQGWPVGEFAPVLMRGRLDADLILRENWTFSSELSFYEAIPDEAKLDFFGVPFYQGDPVHGLMVGDRHFNPMGWLEANVVQFTDPDHLWHDTGNRTFHLWMRAHTGGSGYACVLKAIEQGSTPGTGPIAVGLQHAPSGRAMLYVPCPGGQMKFHVVYDLKTQLYWLLSTQATDSMIQPDHMPADRYNLPNNQRQRLQLHFSKNMVDWCFAGLVCAVAGVKESRHYASMCVDGDDLLILSRSGDERAMSAHNGNLITFHRLPNFRKLVY